MFGIYLLVLALLAQSLAVCCASDSGAFHIDLHIAKIRLLIVNRIEIIKAKMAERKDATTD